MPKAKKKCKVCGKMYDYCYSLRTDVNRWQDVACSPSCASIWFARVKASREKNEESKKD